MLANPLGEFIETKATSKTKYKDMILETFVWKIRVLKQHQKILLTSTESKTKFDLSAQFPSLQLSITIERSRDGKIQ